MVFGRFGKGQIWRNGDPASACPPAAAADALAPDRERHVGQVAAGPLTAAFGAETTLHVEAGMIALAIVATLVLLCPYLERTDRPVTA